MDSFVKFFNQRRRLVDKLVDTTFFRLTDTDTVLDPYIPFMGYNQIELLIRKYESFAGLGAVIGTDQEIPILKPGVEFSEVNIGRILMGAGFVMRQSDYDLLYKFEETMTDTAGRQQIVDAFMGTPIELTRSLRRLLKYLTVQVLQTGGCSYLDAVTNQPVELTYDTEATLFPAALTGNNRWTESSTANGMQDLEDLTYQYYLINGFAPDAWMMSWSTLRNLQNQDSTRAAMVGYQTYRPVESGADTSGIQAPLSALNTALAMRDYPVPPIVPYDQNVDIRNPDGTFTRTRYAEDGYVTALKAGYVEQAGLGFKENNYNAGVAMVTKIESELPLRESMKAMTAGVPFVADPRKLSAQKVHDV